ncbi:hypothetical protein BDY21DRAFT_55285 [Lineolata rhizophorae]|uniref:Uncharacterized protein n=1 Tax=Lineolata rhizophorae TaxID=578093 RepID=A0A6A6NWE5_9PEZI|nr:hypothetical protein BDY21DRAFT_55285 [Lineolata rhizophorae]
MSLRPARTVSGTACIASAPRRTLSCPNAAHAYLHTLHDQTAGCGLLFSACRCRLLSGRATNTAVASGGTVQSTATVERGLESGRLPRLPPAVTTGQQDVPASPSMRQSVVGEIARSGRCSSEQPCKLVSREKWPQSSMRCPELTGSIITFSFGCPAISKTRGRGLSLIRQGRAGNN